MACQLARASAGGQERGRRGRRGRRPTWRSVRSVRVASSAGSPAPPRRRMPCRRRPARGTGPARCRVGGPAARAGRARAEPVASWATDHAGRRAAPARGSRRRRAGGRAGPSLQAQVGRAVEAGTRRAPDPGEICPLSPRLHPRRRRSAYGGHRGPQPPLPRRAGQRGRARASTPPASRPCPARPPGHHYDVAFVQDTQHRRWVVRVPRSQAAAAQMESTFGLLALLARRLPFSVPTPKGFAALKEGGRAAIYPYLPGHTIDFTRLPAGPGLAAELGRVDRGAAQRRPLRSSTRPGCRPTTPTPTAPGASPSSTRAAATGHVPTSLLARWEKALEDVALWRFAPTPDPRRPHRRPGARGVRRRGGRRQRRVKALHRLGGRQGRRPRRRLRRPRPPRPRPAPSRR